MLVLYIYFNDFQIFNMEHWISWSIVVASVIHIFEEYYGGWIKWVQKYAKGVTFPHFVIVNFIFISLCIAASICDSLLFKLSIASLIFVNSVIHIVPTFILRHYSPGIWSAIFLYLPLSLLSFYSAWIHNNLTFQNIFMALLIGILIMTLPISDQFLRIYVTKQE